MVTYVPNKLTKDTIIDIGVLGFNVIKVLLIRPLRWKHVVHSLLCAFTIRTHIIILIFHAWIMRCVCVTGTNHDQRNTINLER